MFQVQLVAFGVALRDDFVHDQHSAVPQTAAGGFVPPYQGAGVFGEVRHGGGHVDGLGRCSGIRQFDSDAPMA